MKNITLLIFLFFSYFLLAQNTVTYDLNNSLAAKENGFADLQPIGDGQFEDDTFEELNSLTRITYEFEKGSGLLFDNASNNNFFSNNYSIEIYFRFEELASWKRIIDYKNRTSDWGLYAKDGRINFYNITTSPDAPLAANEYAHVVVTRNGTTKDYKVYVDGSLISEFTDTDDHGVLNEDNRLIFFQDDTRVPNETSKGNVALIKIYSEPLTASQVADTFTNLTGTLSLSNKNIKTFKMYPNPAKDVLYFDYYSDNTTIKITDVTGKIVLNQILKSQINISNLNQGLYIVTVNDGNSTSSKKLIIK